MAAARETQKSDPVREGDEESDEEVFHDARFPEEEEAVSHVCSLPAVQSLIACRNS